MTATCAWVGVDLGTQSVRAAVLVDGGSGPGRVLLAGVPFNGQRDGVRHEQDPELWWSATAAALRAALAQAGDVRPEGIAVSGTSGTVLLTDTAGRPRTAGLMYDDARGAGQAERADREGRVQWAAQGVAIGASWALAKVLWLLEQGEVRPGDRVAHQADHVAGRLVGHPVAADTSNALKTGADPQLVAWPEPLLGELGVPAGLLPSLVTPGTVLGAVDATAAAATGLPAGLPVVAGMTDGCAAQIAAGAVTDGAWNSVLGTTLVLKGVSAQRHPDPSGAVYCHRAALAPAGAPASWYPGGAASAGAGVLSAQLPDADLGALTDLARGMTDAVPSAYPLTGQGERFPFRAAGAYGHVDGVPLAALPAGRDAEVFRALSYAVARVERLAYDLLDRLGYDVGGPVALTGGGARNPWWNQLRADHLGRPVMVPAEGEGAVGMALLAAAAVTDPSPAGLARLVARLQPVGAELAPDDGRWTGELAAGYLTFVDDLADRGWIDGDLAAHARRRAA